MKVSRAWSIVRSTYDRATGDQQFANARAPVVGYPEVSGAVNCYLNRFRKLEHTRVKVQSEHPTARRVGQRWLIWSRCALQAKQRGDVAVRTSRHRMRGLKSCPSRG